MNIPILMYHEVFEETEFNGQKRPAYASNCVTRSHFEKHMDYLSKNGYSTLSLNELLNEAARNKVRGELNKKVAITFDDGYIGHYVNAYPVLKKYGFTATIFVITNRIGKQNYLSWEQLQEMIANGIQIESHGLSHKPLEILSEHSIKSELEHSKSILENNLKKSVNFISYPQGSYSKKVLEIAKKVGYAGSCTTDIGYYHNNSDPFRIPRINIRQSYDISDIDQILQKNKIFIQKLIFANRIKVALKRLVGLERYLKIYIKIYKMQDYIFTENEIH